MLFPISKKKDLDSLRISSFLGSRLKIRQTDNISIFTSQLKIIQYFGHYKENNKYLSQFDTRLNQIVFTFVLKRTLNTTEAGKRNISYVDIKILSFHW